MERGQLQGCTPGQGAFATGQRPRGAAWGLGRAGEGRSVRVSGGDLRGLGDM